MKSRMHRIRTYLFLILLGITCMATTQAQDVQVNSAYPSSAEQGTVELDVEITGDGFNNTAVVEFFPTGTSASGDIKVKKVKVRGRKKLIATIDVDSEAVVGDFDIEISLSSGRRGRGTTLFSVKKKSTDKLNTELIVFQEALQGWAHVEGCCPNAGPSPRYTMYLPSGLANLAGEPHLPGIYNGELFIAGYGGPHADQTIVQFHACCTGSAYHDDYPCADELRTMSFEIIGGTPESFGKKKDRVHTVTFDHEPYWLDWNRGTAAGEVSFKITIAPSSCTDEICTCEDAIPNASYLCQLP
jgi:hypothetical protein